MLDRPRRFRDRNGIIDRAGNFEDRGTTIEQDGQRVDGHDRAAAGSAPGPTLAQVLAHVGTTVLDLLTGDPTVPGVVEGARTFDPVNDPEIRPRSIVLGVGAADDDAAITLLSQSAAAGAVAVVLKSDVVSPAVLRESQRLPIVLIGLSRGATWVQLMAVLRTATGRAGGESQPSVLSGELFDLANTICTLIDAPITIEDRYGNVLAFSDRQDEADFIRIECILGRSNPEVYRRLDAERGVMDILRRASAPVFFDAIELDDDRTPLPRLAMPVTSGDEYLGTIWAAVRAQPVADHERQLIEASGQVAMRLVRLRGALDARQRIRSDLVEAALRGGPSAVTALGQLGFGGPVLVLAVSFDEPGDGRSLPGTFTTLARRHADRQRFAGALTTALDASLPGSVAAVIHDQVYGIVPARSTRATEATVDAACRSFLSRTASAARTLIGIGRVAEDAAGLAVSRTDADRAVRVLRETAGPGTVARAADVEVAALLLDARDIVRTRGRGPSETYRRLQEYDTGRNTSMLGTLRCWLDAHGDVAAAAAAGHMHPNTLRYRLNRIAEIGGFDPADPTARFELDLQLRLYAQSSGG